MNRIEIGANVWPWTLALFDDLAASELEGGCFWYGVRATLPEQASRITTIGVPKQINRRRNFSIPTDALVELNSAVGPDEEVLVQLHGHPGVDVAMSEWDEELAVSRRIVSIVLPFWGASKGLAVSPLGVHRFEGGAWQMLPDAEVADRIVTRAGPHVRLVDCR